MNIKLPLLLLLLVTGFNLKAQESGIGNNFVVVPPGSTPEQVVALASRVTPSQRQLDWQEMEMTAFLHFTVNTFYNQEWGLGTEDPKKFNPVQFDAKQWVQTCREAGLKCVIITAKHHDGFCLWPSRYTAHSVAASPWRDGKGDIVKEVSDECHKQGLKFGVYLSPWDRHEKTYGTEEYNQHFRDQLTELLTNYGRIDEVWFDGACGEGPNGKRQVYDWESYYKLIRKLQPHAVIAIMGPDIRWVGTESGYGRETEWSVVPLETADQEAIAANSQQQASNDGFVPAGDMTNADLGSREKIAAAKTLIWYPSEVDVSIRPGWFWHESENDRVKSPEKLLDIYFSSVGRNSVLLLNIPPDDRGLIHENDIKTLREWRRALDEIFKTNLAGNTKINIVEGGNLQLAALMLDADNTTHWTTEGSSKAAIEFCLPKEEKFDVLMLAENIRTGQRIEKFHLDALVNEKWETVTSGTTVGYKRLLCFPAVETDRVRLYIDESRLNPTIAEFGLYRHLPEVKACPQSAAFTDSLKVSLVADDEGTDIYYKLDGSSPDENAEKYIGPFSIRETTTIRFIGISRDGKRSFTQTACYFKAKHGITLANAPDGRYAGGGPLGLTDGAHGSHDFGDGRWSGFNGTDLHATIDLKEIRTITKISAGFLESTHSWIFFPEEVIFEASADGKSFTTLGSVKTGQSSSDQEEIREISLPVDTKARYIRVIARNIGTLPAWHPGHGEKAWLFCDEISIE
ncbi:MAG TPA: alpha-L-fucosidase [Bacteroidales bacterium]|nr:alpha-L-fucosidase [Bacteroidales bacterium]